MIEIIRIMINIDVYIYIYMNTIPLIPHCKRDVHTKYIAYTVHNLHLLVY